MITSASWLLINDKGQGLINGKKEYSFKIESGSNGWNIGELQYSFLEACTNYELEAPLDDETLHRILRDAVISYGKRTTDEKKAEKGDDNEASLTDRELLILEATNYLESKYVFRTIDENDEIRYFETGALKPKGEILIKTELQAKYKGQLTIGIVREVLENIRRDTYRPKEAFDTNIAILNLKNGLYNILTGDFTPHTEKPPVINGKEYLSLRQSPITYNPKTQPKLFGRFLNQVLYPKEIRTAVEAMAYSFWRDNPIEAYFILLGTGRNGKSVLTRVLTELHGRECTSNVPMSAIQTDPRFAISDMENKNINIDTELSSAAVKDMAIIKRITTRQPFRIDRKNQRAYDTILTTKLWFNTNQIPETNDDSDAHYAREIIISFPSQFVDSPDPTDPKQKKADPKMIEKLTAEDELSGIFNVLMTALRTVLKNNAIYQQAKTIQERRLKSKRAMNPIAAFFEEGNAEDVTLDDQTEKSLYYEGYKTYCTYYQLHYEAETTFAKILKEDRGKYRLQDGRPAIKGERVHVWKGVKLAEWLLKEMNKTKAKQTTLPA